MWDSPAWLSSAIRAKIDERIAYENRLSNEGIAEANRLSNEKIAEANRQSNQTIAALNRASNENIAAAERSSRYEISELDRASREEIAAQQVAVNRYGIDVQASTAAAQRILERDLTNIRIESNERIANNEINSREGIAAADRSSRELINAQNIKANLYNEAKRRELTASEGAANRELTREEGKANRENQLDIAKLNVAQRVVSDGVRLVPYFVGSSGFKFNGTGGTSNSAPAVSMDNNAVKSKADALFPTLEPTFKSSGLAALGALLVSGAAGFASFVPFI